MERLSFTETVHSTSNRLLWRLRSAVKFRRGGYSEAGVPDFVTPPGAKAVEKHYRLGALRKSLSTESYLKNLFTLCALENLLVFLEELPKKIQILEPGSQDFSRLPAIRLFFEAHGFSPEITGLELDAFPLLQSLHSRADKAEYYRQLLRPSADHFEAADFFQWQNPVHCILSFYPFVSPHPALAWGIPAEFGSAEKWVASFERNLREGGLLFVIHQGEWEENEFDRARENSALELVLREQVKCEFYPLPHPACVSIYRKSTSH